MRASLIVFFLFASTMSLSAQETPTRPIRVGVIAAANELTNGVRATGVEPSFGVVVWWRLPTDQTLVFEWQEFSKFANDDTSNTFFGWSLDVSQVNALYQHVLGENVSVSGGIGLARIKETYRGSGSGYFPPHPLADGQFAATNRGPSIMAGLQFRGSERLSLVARIHAYLGDLESLGAPGPALQADEGKPVIASLGLRFAFTR